MGRAKPKKSKKSVVINPEDGEPVSFISEDNGVVVEASKLPGGRTLITPVWGEKEQAEAEEVLRFDETTNG